jgi:hypothetical protein
LANNYIKSLPATISNLQNLHQLYLDGNFLTTLPETFASLPNEMLLNLIYNCINTNALAPTVYDYLESLAPYIETTYSWEGRWEYNFQEGNQAQCRYNLIDIDTEEDQIFS